MRCSPATPTTPRPCRRSLATMEARHCVLGRVWIADRGMASAENLAWLRQTGRRYFIGAPKSELKKFACELARRDRWRPVREGVGGQARAPSRDRRDGDPVPLRRPAQQRACDARQVQSPDRAGARTPLGSPCARQETARRDESEPTDRTHPAAKPARRRPLHDRLGG